MRRARWTRRTGDRPVALRLAAAAQAAEAAGLCVAGVFAAVATADGQSYQQGSGIALTLIAFCTAVTLATLAWALKRARAWSRTPVVMTQLFVGGAGLYLVIGHRFDWGVPALLLAAGCLAGLLTPTSLRALNRTFQPSLPTQPAQKHPGQKQPAQKQPAQKQPAQKHPGQKHPTQKQTARKQPARKATR